MKLGIKIYRISDRDMSKIIEQTKPDFIETMAIEGEDYSGLKEFGLPVTIHCQHTMFGVNLANPLIEDRNRKAVGFAIKTADMLEAGTIVIHPGYMDNHSCGYEQLLSFLKSAYDPRIAIENMPNTMNIGKDVMNLGHEPKDIMNIISETGVGFCLDIPHAVAAAAGTEKYYKDILREFLSIKPTCFHLSGTVVGQTVDKHLHLDEGDLDIGMVKKMLPKDAWVTLEVPTDTEGMARDIAIMRS